MSRELERAQDIAQMMASELNRLSEANDTVVLEVRNTYMLIESVEQQIDEAMSSLETAKIYLQTLEEHSNSQDSLLYDLHAMVESLQEKLDALEEAPEHHNNLSNAL